MATHFEITVGATFTADPLTEYLTFWLDHLGITGAVRMTPYNLVFQQLLDPGSDIRKNTTGANVILLRLEDWRIRPAAGAATDAATTIEAALAGIPRSIDDFLAAIDALPAAVIATLIVAVCPPSCNIVDHPAAARALVGLEMDFVARLLHHTGLRVVTSEAATGVLPPHEYHAARRLAIGHIPYTDVAFAQLSTEVMRRVYRQFRTPYKVIVLDCDQTLWTGYCGESGPASVTIDEARQFLQAFMVSQIDAGMLLCICSRNNDADVDAVFNDGPEMPLRRGDILAWRVNWQPKSHNIRELAHELNVGTDSIIFIDDNPVECAEVQANLPEVLTLQLPESDNAIVPFLACNWVFDHDTVSDVDRRRSILYRENFKREHFRTEALDFRSFIDGLELDIAIVPLPSSGCPRAAQLAQRTNQFNLTNCRIDEAELTDSIAAADVHCHMVSVRDRFGDYGVVGLIIVACDRGVATVSALLMSCRVMGRGVEHRMLAHAANQAVAAGAETLRLDFVETGKNEPALAFLRSVDVLAESAVGDHRRFSCSCTALCSLAFDPDVAVNSKSNVEANVEAKSVRAADDKPRTSAGAVAEIMTEIALELSEPEALRKRVRRRRQRQRASLKGEFFPAYTDAEKTVAAIWADVLVWDVVGIHDNFFDLGGDSVKNVAVHERLEAAFARQFPVTRTFQHATVHELAAYLEDDLQTAHDTKRPDVGAAEHGDTPTPRPHGDIAIIGMAGRFPGAADTDAFWDNLVNGRECISFFTDDELAAAGVDPDLVRNDPDYVCAGGVLNDAEDFDAGFFGITPREAELTDPQHRVFLECAWHALEDAGYDHERLDVAVGVFAGKARNNYFTLNLLPNRDHIPAVDGLVTELGNEMDYMPTRVSYVLNLKGPSVSIQTACSTSLVAIFHACQSLSNGHCGMALAGGVTVLVPQTRGYRYHEGHFSSPDGHTRTYDEKGQGTLFSNGAGIVVLKRLEDAVTDRDHIYAVIRGIAINNDGSDKVGYMAPSVNGQADVIAAALDAAGVRADEISYVEGHGTATPLGDPIEVAALTQAYRRHTEMCGYCGLGSVKSNIGHLDAAAGVAGLMKTALALRRGCIPPSINFNRPNPKFSIDQTPFYIQTSLRDWNSGDSPRIAAVSSFGVGGTNAHAVVQEAPATTTTPGLRGVDVLLVSARTKSVRDRLSQNLADYLETHTDASLADVGYTLATGRRRFKHGRAVVCADRIDAVSRLRNADGKGSVAHTRPAHGGAVVFMFPGQGSQHPGMTADLYDCEPAFRDAVDYCADILEQHSGEDIRTLLYPADGSDEAVQRRLRQTIAAQPAIFVVEYALTMLWREWGVTPGMMVGHSVGEFVAACLAGVLPLEDAIRLLAIRGRLMQDLPSGGMTAVSLNETALQPYLAGTDLAIAAVNAPMSCVVSGEHGQLATFKADLDRDGVGYRDLHTSHAFHSAMVDPAISKFTNAIEGVELRPPETPIVSSVTGTILTDAQATDPAYWSNHMRETVRFHDARCYLAQQPHDILLEVGPGNTLTSLARLGGKDAPQQIAFASLGHIRDERCDSHRILEALGRLWTLGIDIDWQGFYRHEKRTRTPLPGYPFARRRCWIDPPTATIARDAAAGARVVGTPSNTAQPATAARFHNKKETTMAPAPAAAAKPVPQVSPRNERILARIRDTMEDLAGIVPEDVDPDASFLELGFDSLFLTQASMAFKKAFKVDITFRQLLENTPTPAALATYIDTQLPPDALPPVASVVTGGPPSTVAVAYGSAHPLPQEAGVLERVIAQQIQVMNRQLDMLRHSGDPAAARDIATPATSAADADTPAAEPVPRFGPWKPTERSAGQAIDPALRTHIDALVRRFVGRTGKSKALTQQYRAKLADPRAVAGFKNAWKEMVYPIVSERSSGSRIWDVDGNVYIDMTMGFGSVYFGHSPEWITSAIHKQLESGVEIGPQSRYAGEVATAICDMVGMERLTFCNTGSEAVMAAIRLARTVSGRNKIVFFSDDYHGIFDEVLARSTPGSTRRTVPVAPGIPRESVANVVVLAYGDMAAIEEMKAIADDLAAVIVEPVQARHPDLQPRAFLHALRKWTASAGVALVFDEVITGFRLSPGGAQAFYGVQADLACYGKIIGGGMPIGLLAGKSTYMDALDGGAWQYGDASFPETGVTYFAGTFVRHPLAVAAARAVVGYLLEQGPELQKSVNRRGDAFADDLNAFFHSRRAPLRLEHCGSMSYLSYLEEDAFSGLLFYYLRERGVHIWDHRAIFVTPAHSDTDLDAVKTAFRESVIEMQSAGLLAGGPVAACTDTAPSPVDVSEEGQCAAGPVFLPLTDAQTEVWLAAQINENASRAFNENVVFRIIGDLSVDAIRTAIQELVNRHDALRTTFEADGSAQVIHAGLDIDLPVITVDGDSKIVRRKCLDRLIHSHVNTVFDIERGPLLRAAVFAVEPGEHVLILSVHHLVCDGWSSGVLIDELGTFYTCACTGAAANLEPALQMRDYVARKNQSQDAAARKRIETYWIDRFRGDLPVLDLPGDRPRPAMQTFTSGMRTCTFDTTMVEAIRKVGGRNGCTLSTTLLGAYMVLLHRLSGSNDIIVGISLAGQPLADNGASLVGHCVNMLPIRAEIGRDQTFADFIRQLNAAMLDSHDYQDYTFGSLLRHLKLRRDPSRTPLVSVEFTLEPEPDLTGFAGLDVSILPDPNTFYNKDLFFNFVNAGNRIKLLCEFAIDMFDAATIDRWLASFRTMLTDVIAAPDTPISQLSLLDDAQREFVHHASCGDSDPLPHDPFVHEIISNTARCEPDAIGCVAGAHHLSRGELERRSGSLAGYLIESGVDCETPVGLCVERSVDLLVGMLAVLKSGAAFVPLDPTFPARRLQAVIADAGISTVVTTAMARNALEGGSADASSSRRLRVIAFDTDWSDISTYNLHEKSTLDPANLAYVIYTSGSTGAPKGVQITHAALTNLLHTMHDRPGITVTDVLLALTTVSFDIAMLELLMPLASGCRMVIADLETTGADGNALTRLIDDQRVTVAQGTPATWQLLFNTGWQGCAHLRVLCGGELMSGHIASRLADGNCEVWNLYGPTETTIWSTRHAVAADGGSPPIGRPVANTQVYVLDGSGQLLPPGIPGMLYIAGAGLARSYRSRADLTADAFVPNPYATIPGARMYRTGDEVTMAIDGSLRFRGRRDFQVKVRGFRIETGEIEGCLVQHPGIVSAVVVVREFRTDDLRLVAYVVPAGAVEVNGGGRSGRATISDLTAAQSDWRDFLRQTLPDYMVPSVFVPLTELPRTANGKIARDQLPAPSRLRNVARADAEAPTSATEKMIAGVWMEVLGDSSLNTTDNFFDLGGHSLLAMTVISKIKALSGARIGPMDLMFNNLKQLASVCDEHDRPDS